MANNGKTQIYNRHLVVYIYIKKKSQFFIYKYIQKEQYNINIWH